MTRLKDLEHDGGEEVNRKDVKNQREIMETLQNTREKDYKLKQQEKYLQPENPALWDGDID